MDKQQLYKRGDQVILKSSRQAKVRRFLWAAGHLFFYDVRIEECGTVMIYEQEALTPA